LHDQLNPQPKAAVPNLFSQHMTRTEFWEKSVGFSLEFSKTIFGHSGVNDFSAHRGL
jgi:hypothetical protein